ncbi:MAG: carboxypeptidase regulatory-like domain-containing protein, partial [Kiritimatiellae bacterium]|nr:carboxypeptidase regulatory-like domain-containing protein [Kiritimatiellia bacterium]
GGLDEQSAVTISGADELDEDFGYVPIRHIAGAGLIGDTIYLDRDGDGVVGADEGLVGITVDLYDTNGNVVASVETGVRGYYFFGNLPDGVYTVAVDTVTLPAGVTNSVDPDGGLDSRSAVTISGGSVNLDQDFAYTVVTPNGISGTIWEDVDADGTLATNEFSRIAGITVMLVDSNGNAVATDVTDANGDYEFSGLPDGTYSVDVTDDDNLLDGYWHSDGTNNAVDNNSQDDPYEVTVSGGQTNITADFGYFVYGARIGNWVWYDNDDNDIQSTGDTGIASHPLTLEIGYGAITTTVVTVTDAGGYYGFYGLLLDESNADITYKLTTPIPDGYYPVLALAREEDYIDSNYISNTVPVVVRGSDEVGIFVTSDTTLHGASSYDFGFDIHPTLVVVSSFGAATVGDNVLVSWGIEMEIGTMGYYLERQTESGWVRVNSRLISRPPFDRSPPPYNYSVVDLGAESGGTYSWRIVELDNQGRLLKYGPYTVTVDGAVINYESWAAGVDWLGADSSRTADADGDALNNFEEYLASTDPLNENSLLRISGVSIAAEGGVVVRWQSISNVVYAIEFSTNIIDNWLPISSDIQATPPMNTSTVAVDEADAPQMFFRIIGK